MPFLSSWGFILWFGGVLLTNIHIPVIIGAVLEGSVIGFVIGLIFGIFSLVQAAIAPNGPADVIFTNPFISVLPRLLIGPIAWLAWNSLKRWQVVGLVAAGVVGSLTNTLLVLGAIGLLGIYPWIVLSTIVVSNGLPEAILSGILVLMVIAAIQQIPVQKRKGANL